MQVSKHKIPDEQLWLFPKDRRIQALGQVRHVCGDYFERKTTELVQGERLRSDCRCEYCPDVRTHDGTFLEVKSCGAGRRMMVYEWRIRKDLDFIAEGNRLFYVLWHHNLGTNGIRWESQLRKELSQACVFCVIVDVRTIWDIVQEKPLRKLADRHYSNHYYTKHGGLGYTVALTQILAETSGYSEQIDGVDFYYESHEAWRMLR